jgi:hypothetical protein
MPEPRDTTGTAAAVYTCDRKEHPNGIPCDRCEPTGKHACNHALCPHHACCLEGLWWGDEEFGPAVDALWREYIDRRHEWLRYETEVATALGHLRRVVA